MSDLKANVRLRAGDCILWSPCLTEGMQSVLTLPRDEFKRRSNQGVVWYGQAPKDLGNWAYALLFQFLFRWSKFAEVHDVHELFDTLAERYSTLQLKARVSKGSISMKGDVIEMVQSGCRQRSTLFSQGYPCDLCDSTIFVNFFCS